MINKTKNFLGDTNKQIDICGISLDILDRKHSLTTRCVRHHFNDIYRAGVLRGDAPIISILRNLEIEEMSSVRELKTSIEAINNEVSQ